MPPTPTLQELIEAVEHDATGDETLELLAQASRTVAELEQVGDALLDHFVEQCRRSGRSWSEISGALGVSKQAAHKRFTFPPPTFERFTQRARAVVADAPEQARHLGHGFVGTEHLLLALFEPTESLAARALADAGVTRAAAAAELAKLAAPGTDTGEMARPFTPRAKEALRQALVEALALGHNYIGTEHLLLGLFADGHSYAAQILAALGLERDALASRVGELLAAYAAAKPAGRDG